MVAFLSSLFSEDCKINALEWQSERNLLFKKVARWLEAVLLSQSQIIVKNLQKKLWRSKHSAHVSDGLLSVSPVVSTTCRDIVATRIMTTFPVDRNPWKLFSILWLLLFTSALSCHRITASCGVTSLDATDLLTPNNLTKKLCSFVFSRLIPSTFLQTQLLMLYWTWCFLFARFLI